MQGRTAAQRYQHETRNICGLLKSNCEMQNLDYQDNEQPKQNTERVLAEMW